MKITIWQNVEFEDPSVIKDWADDRGYELNIQKTYLNEDLNIADALIVLGGPMSVYDNLEFLKPVKIKLKEHINSGGAVYGICLGAQLIAEALGAKVYSSGTREIGWRGVEIKKSGLTSSLSANETVFHWHGDTFDLPESAELLASNDAFRNQAFSANGGKILGTQFHFEATLKSINVLLGADKEYINFDSPFINDDFLREDDIAKANNALFKVLDAWIKASMLN